MTAVAIASQVDAPVAVPATSVPEVSVAEVSEQTSQRGSNVTASKKQRKGPKGGTMKPPKDAQPKKDSQQQPKKPAGQAPKQKGPKNGKPKASPYQFYYQQLAADLALDSSAVAEPKSRPAKSNSVAVKSFDALKNGPTITQTETVTTTTTTTTTVKKERTLTIQIAERPTTPRSDATESDSSSDATLTPYPNATFQPKRRLRYSKPQQQHTVITLDNVNAVAALESLLERYGGVQHGGILDANYSFFVNRTRTAAISFIVKDKIAVVGGDPLCEPFLFDAVFAEFKEYRKKHGFGIAIFGGGSDLLAYGKKRGWASIRFGTERVLNPLDNPVLQEKVQKQVIRQNKQLLDPEKYGLSLGVYSPAQRQDPLLQSQLVGVYEAWREAKNASGRPQSYTTIYDPFALPNLMIYIYTKDKEGRPNGFAALRKMGAKKGYYIDPCVAAPGAPRRITDLLYFTAMAMLNNLGCGYLSIGMEPATELDISGFGDTVEKLARKAYARMFDGLKLGGKAEYYSKFRPDESLEQGLYLMFPKGVPSVRQLLAVTHFANISIRAVVRRQIDQKLAARAAEKDQEADDAGKHIEGEDSDEMHSESSSASSSQPSRPQTAVGEKADTTKGRPTLPRLRSALSLRSFRSVPDLKAATKAKA